LNHEHKDWSTNSSGYNFGTIKQGDISAEAKKHPDKTIEIKLTGPFDKAFVFQRPIPQCDQRGLQVAMTWKDNKVQLYHGTGCNRCNHTGYHGRKSVYEILCISPGIRRMILDRSDDDAIKQQAIKEGMKTLHQSAVDEVLNGVTTVEELVRVVDVEAD